MPSSFLTAHVDLNMSSVAFFYCFFAFNVKLGKNDICFTYILYTLFANINIISNVYNSKPSHDK